MTTHTLKALVVLDLIRMLLTLFVGINVSIVFICEGSNLQALSQMAVVYAVVMEIQDLFY